jgi:hypothetical protein
LRVDLDQKKAVERAEKIAAALCFFVDVVYPAEVVRAWLKTIWGRY